MGSTRKNEVTPMKHAIYLAALLVLAGLAAPANAQYYDSRGNWQYAPPWRGGTQTYQLPVVTPPQQPTFGGYYPALAPQPYRTTYYPPQTYTPTFQYSPPARIYAPSVNEQRYRRHWYPQPR